MIDGDDDNNIDVINDDDTNNGVVNNVDDKHLNIFPIYTLFPFDSTVIFFLQFKNQSTFLSCIIFLRI